MAIVRLTTTNDFRLESFLKIAFVCNLRDTFDQMRRVAAELVLAPVQDVRPIWRLLAADCKRDEVSGARLALEVKAAVTFALAAREAPTSIGSPICTLPQKRRASDSLIGN